MELPFSNAPDGTGILQLHGSELLLVEKNEPFYIDSKTTLALSLDYFLGTQEFVYEKSSFSRHHVPGIRLCCPKNHSTCIDLRMFIFIHGWILLS